MKKYLKTLIYRNKCLKNKQLILSKLLQESARRQQKKKEVEVLHVQKSAFEKLFTREVDKAYCEGSIAVDLSKFLKSTLLEIKIRGLNIGEKRVAFEKGLDLKRIWIHDNINGLPYYTWRDLVNSLQLTKTSLENIEYAPFLTKFEAVVKKDTEEKDTEEEDIEEADIEEKDESKEKIFSQADMQIHELSIFTFMGDLKKFQKRKKKKKEDHLILQTYDLGNKFDIRYEIEASAEEITEIELSHYFNDYAVKYKGLPDEDINFELDLQKNMVKEYANTGLLFFNKKSTGNFNSFGINFSEISKRSVSSTPNVFTNSPYIRFKKNESDLFFFEEKEKKNKLIEKLQFITCKGQATFHKYKNRVLGVNEKLYSDYMWFANNYKSNTAKTHAFKFYQFKQIFDYIALFCVLSLLQQFFTLLEEFHLVTPRDTNILITISNYIDKTIEYINDMNVIRATQYLTEHVNNLMTPHMKKFFHVQYNQTGIVNMILNDIFELWKIMPMTQNIQEIVFPYVKTWIASGEFITSSGINLLDTFC